MFESRFWKRNIYRLANVREKTAADTDFPLFRRLSKHSQLWASNPDANLDDELHRLEAQIVKFARSVRSSETEVTYRFLIGDFGKERAESVAQNPTSHRRMKKKQAECAYQHRTRMSDSWGEHQSRKACPGRNESQLHRRRRTLHQQVRRRLR
jgi:hypothetical protein